MPVNERSARYRNAGIAGVAIAVALLFTVSGCKKDKPAEEPASTAKVADPKEGGQDQSTITAPVPKTTRIEPAAKLKVATGKVALVDGGRHEIKVEAFQSLDRHVFVRAVLPETLNIGQSDEFHLDVIGNRHGVAVVQPAQELSVMVR
ncbi:MAG: hypothetical protein ACI9OJ_004230 [Myxococcota bacterium]|jgi:hypothetical protein